MQNAKLRMQNFGIYTINHNPLWLNEIKTAWNLTLTLSEGEGINHVPTPSPSERGGVRFFYLPLLPLCIHYVKESHSFPKVANLRMVNGIRFVFKEQFTRFKINLFCLNQHDKHFE
ncbi:MAG: hypothetical protein NT007_05260 [Candidatus Kapabacteria bacterium]|nr:hypothetical protein [Candidatus Kapabacteria bacterium]